jgi:hypothetical protein
MSKIYGDKETINRSKKALPGDSISYVNWEAINELPDEFESRIEKIEFDIDKDFDLTGDDLYYPQPDLMNRIAEKRGISGTNDSIIESIIEELNINPLLCKPMEDAPTMRKKIIGKRMTKIGYTVELDGTLKPCLPCTVDFNVWERCCKEWAKEEEKTNGYDTAIQKTLKDGTIFYDLKYYDKNKREEVKYKFFPKYDNKWKRNLHFENIMLFAQRNTDTKSKNVVVRTIVGMKTGYSKDDLKEGFFIVHRICRSREILRLEAAANVTRISSGGTVSPAGDMLFGLPDNTKKPDDDIPDVTPDEEPPSPLETLLGLFQSYEKMGLELSSAESESLSKCIKWIQNKPDDTKPVFDRLWNKALGVLGDIEKKTDFGQTIEHDLYKV